MSQDVCPYNQTFAKELSEPAFAPTAALAGKDARSLAFELLSMSQPEFSAAFKDSPMKRPNLRGLKRDSAVVLGNVGSFNDVPALAAALEDSEPLVQSHASSTLGRIGCPATAEALRAWASDETDASVLAEQRAALSELGPKDQHGTV